MAWISLRIHYIHTLSHETFPLQNANNYLDDRTYSKECRIGNFRNVRARVLSLNEK